METTAGTPLGRPSWILQQRARSNKPAALGDRELALPSQPQQAPGMPDHGEWEAGRLEGHHRTSLGARHGTRHAGVRPTTT
jgi:hypothetical protein